MLMGKEPPAQTLLYRMKLATSDGDDGLPQNGDAEPREGVSQEGQLRKSLDDRRSRQTERSSTDLDYHSTWRIHIALHNFKSGAPFHPDDGCFNDAATGL